ncbi:DDE_3 domain-containing protein [Trichonephila clavipes]|nr:DDE_3 domain-containing protein [Trichonephila clavipes]
MSTGRVITGGLFSLRMSPGSVCVWSGISLGGRTSHHIFSRGNANAPSYRGDILDAYVRPYAREIGDSFVLQDGNARPHRSRIVGAYLEQETIRRMQWPARSLDFNPIEHVLDDLGRHVATLNPPPRTLGTRFKLTWKSNGSHFLQN